MPRVSASFLGALVAAVVVCAAPDTAWAQSARYELDSGDQLIEDGWFYAHEGGTSSFSASLLRLQSTKGYNEFLLRNESDKPALTTGWVGTADPGRGWWVEARLSVAVTTQCFGGGPGLSVDDGKISVRLLFDTSGVHFTAPQVRDVAVPLTSNLHTYRVQSLGNRHVQLMIDGKLVDDEPVQQNSGSAKTLEFGDLGGCDATDATWDYVAYDTFGPTAAPGDDDQDGVANAKDNCVLVANSDQKDGDADGAGDACDLCPKDAQNDQDNDGKCADVDVCPGDARNDQDNNGVCDTMQCASYEVMTVPFGNCPPACYCRMRISDAFGGFGNFDNIGGASNAGIGGTNSGSAGKGVGGAGLQKGAQRGRAARWAAAPWWAAATWGRNRERPRQPPPRTAPAVVVALPNAARRRGGPCRG